MSRAEKTELLLIALVTATCGIFAGRLPAELSLGKLLLVLSALFFLQSLLRDLWLLSAARRRSRTEPPRHVQCMCLESTFGLGVLLVALVLIGAGVGSVYSIAPSAWPVFAAGVMIGCFLMKDLVVEWNPWRIRREKDHLNVVVQWRRPRT